jgi:thiamine monophosphate kinase
MTDPTLLPAATGTEQRLDLLIGEIRALRSLLAPASKPEPKDGESIELREPGTAAQDFSDGLRGEYAKRKRR